MTDPTPADRLRQAAALLRKRAVGTTPPPWRHDGPWWHDTPATGDATPTGLITGDGPNRTAVMLGVPHGDGHEQTEANLKWAATLHPGVAEPLAALLDASADYVWPGHPLVTVADAILAGGDRG